MDAWVYIVIAIVYVLFSAFSNAKKASNPDAEGKNNTPEENPDRNVIHNQGEKNPRTLVLETERRTEQKKQRSLEGMSLEEFINSMSNPKEKQEEPSTVSSEDTTLGEFLEEKALKRQIAAEKRENPAKTLEKTSRDEEIAYRQEIKKTSYQKTQESHYNEESLVQNYETTHKLGKTLPHHLHGQSAAGSAYNYDFIKSKKSRIRRLIRHNNDLKRSYLVSLLLEKKFDND